MRFLVMALCLTTLVLYGHAIGGLWGYLIGKPGMPSIIGGLLGGTATAAAAIYLWHRYMVKNLYSTPSSDKETGQGQSES